MNEIATCDGALRVADIVTSHPECARVLKQHGIDFCCQGQQTLAEACEGRGLELEEVVQEIQAAIRARGAGSREDDPRALSIAALVARIIERHHAWLRESLPWIRDMAAKVGRVHGGHDPRLVELAEVVHRLHGALIPHLDDEEQGLFPLLMARARGPKAEVEQALVAMETEHREVGLLLERTRALTEDFSPPAWACGTYRTLLAELEHLEDDVLRHVHLENHVLAPKARAGLAPG